MTEHTVDASSWSINAKQYMCCSRSMHITRAAKLVARIEIVLTLLLLLASFVYVEALQSYYSRVLKASSQISTWPAFAYVFLLCLAATYILCCWMVIYGVNNDRPSYLLPYIAVNVFLCYVGLFQAGVMIVLPFIFTDYAMLLVLLLISQIVEMAMHMWFTAIVFRCYKFLNDKMLIASLGRGGSAMNALNSCSGVVVADCEANPIELKLPNNEE